MPATSGSRNVARPKVAHRRTVVIAGIVVVLIAAMIALTLTLRSRPSATAAPLVASALTVVMVQPRNTRWVDSLEVSGTVAPWQEASIRSMLTGEHLTEIDADIGSVVKRGQVLARYDTAMLEANAAQSTAALRQAQASAIQARTNESRALQMNDSGGISQQDLLQYATTAKVTAAQEDAARAQLQARMVDLQNAVVRAPDDGTLSARVATLGSVTPVGQELFRLIRQDRLQWQAEITASDLASVQPGQRVTVQLPDTTIVHGTISHIAPSLDSQMHVAIAYADLDSGSRVRAGMYAGGCIERGERRALAVPASSIAMHDGHSTVAVIDERDGIQRVSVRDVTTGSQRGDLIEIVSGLSETERIVREGAALLNEGDVVTLANGAPATHSTLSGMP